MTGGCQELIKGLFLYNMVYSASHFFSFCFSVPSVFLEWAQQYVFIVELLSPPECLSNLEGTSLLSEPRRRGEFFEFSSHWNHWEQPSLCFLENTCWQLEFSIILPHWTLFLSFIAFITICNYLKCLVISLKCQRDKMEFYLLHLFSIFMKAFYRYLGKT